MILKASGASTPTCSSGVPLPRPTSAAPGLSLRVAVGLLTCYAGVLAWGTLVEKWYGGAAAHFGEQVAAPNQYLRCQPHGLKDLFCMVAGKGPHMVPAVADPGTFACMNTPDAMEGYKTLVPKDFTMNNEVPARILLMISAYRPIMYARRISCPVLIMYAKNDSLIPAKAVERMGSKIPDAEVIGLPVGHFDVYTGELFKQVVHKQVTFLLRNL